MAEKPQYAPRTDEEHTLTHLVWKAESAGLEAVEIPPDTRMRDVAAVIARFNEGRSVQASHAIVEGPLASGAFLIRFAMLIP